MENQNDQLPPPLPPPPPQTFCDPLESQRPRDFLQNVRTPELCSLIHATTWHEFLSIIAPDILQNLHAYLTTNSGCQNYNRKMQDIITQIVDRGFEKELLQFFHTNHRQMIMDWNVFTPK